MINYIIKLTPLRYNHTCQPYYLLYHSKPSEQESDHNHSQFYPDSQALIMVHIGTERLLLNTQVSEDFS